MARRAKTPVELARDSTRALVGSPLRATETVLVLGEAAAASYGGRKLMGRAEELGRGIDKQIDDARQVAHAAQDMAQNAKQAVSDLYATVVGDQGPDSVLQSFATYPQATPEYRAALERYEQVGANPGADMIRGLEGIIIDGASASDKALGDVNHYTGAGVKNWFKSKTRELSGSRPEQEHDRENAELRSELYGKCQMQEQTVDDSLRALIVRYAGDPKPEFYEQATDLLTASTTLRTLQYALHDVDTQVDTEAAQDLFKQQMDIIEHTQQEVYTSIEQYVQDSRHEPMHFFQDALPLTAAVVVAAAYLGVVRYQRKAFRSLRSFKDKVVDAFTVEVDEDDS